MQQSIGALHGVGETYRHEHDEYGLRSTVVVAESYGATWVDRDGDTVCYVYWRPATREEADAFRAVEVIRPRPKVATLPIEYAPRVGQVFRLRDGSRGVAVDVRNRRYLDSGSEDVSSFYSSELWDRTVVDVEYSIEGAQA